MGHRTLLHALLPTAVLALTTVVAPPASAVGDSPPVLVSPEPGSATADGFTGPYEVDLSAAPVGAYAVNVTCDGSGQTWQRQVDYAGDGDDTQTFNGDALHGED